MIPDLPTCDRPSGGVPAGIQSDSRAEVPEKLEYGDDQSESRLPALAGRGVHRCRGLPCGRERGHSVRDQGSWEGRRVMASAGVSEVWTTDRKTFH